MLSGTTPIKAAKHDCQMQCCMMQTHIVQSSRQQDMNWYLPYHKDGMIPYSHTPRCSLRCASLGGRCTWEVVSCNQWASSRTPTSSHELLGSIAQPTNPGNPCTIARDLSLSSSACWACTAAVKSAAAELHLADVPHMTDVLHATAGPHKTVGSASGRCAACDCYASIWLMRRM